MSKSIDDNIEYLVGKSGNYLTKRRKNILDVQEVSLVSNAVVLTEDMTGSVVLLPDSSANTDVITLPATPANGTNFKLLFGTDLTASFVMAGAFEGGGTVAGDYFDLAAAASITFTGTKVKAGDYMTCVYISGKWYCEGVGTLATAFATA